MSEEPQVGRSPFDPVRDNLFKKELVTLIPHLRAFARTLTGDPTAADDLAQDAMMKAWDARASFQLGTNMKAWTFMILRNQFYSEKRRSAGARASSTRKPPSGPWWRSTIRKPRSRWTSCAWAWPCCRPNSAKP
jgi:RNA polymerase sigma factor (sigma-70 family)